MNPPSKSNKLQPKRKFTTTDTLLRQSVPSSKLRKPCPLPYTPSSTPMPSSNLCKPCPPPYTPFPRPFSPSMPLLDPSSTQGISTTLPPNSSSTHMRSVVPIPPSKPSSQVPSSESPATQSSVPAATHSSQVLSSIPATTTTQSSVPAATRSSVPAATRSRSSVPAATRSSVPAATRSSVPAATQSSIPAATQSYIPATQSAAAEVPSSGVDTQSYIPATQSSGAATQSYIPATQSAVAEVPSSVVDTQSGRKRNKLKNVAKRTTPVQVKVNTNGEPDGDGDTGAHTFWAWQSWLLKNHMRYPLTAANHWKMYPMNLKEKLWREMEEKWILEGLSQEIFYKKAGEALRQIRKSYRKNYFYRNINCDWSDPLKYLPPDFPPEQWPVLVNQWSDPHYVDIAEKNLDNRVENPHPNHHMGSTGYPALTSKMISEAELENRSLPDDFDIWVKGVTNKKGEVDDASQTIINRFNEKVIEFMNEDESTPESQHPTSTPRERAWNFVNDERNSAKHGYRLGKGSGPTITMLLGGRKMQKIANEEVVRKLTATEHELEATKVKLKETQDKMARMEAFLEKKFGYIDGSSTS